MEIFMTEAKVNLSAFQDFLRRQLETTNKSRLAARLGVAHTTLNRWLSDNPPLPDLEKLISIAKATGYNVDELVHMVYPDVVIEGEPSPTALRVAREFDELPESLQSAIMAIIRSARQGFGTDTSEAD